MTKSRSTRRFTLKLALELIDEHKEIYLTVGQYIKYRRVAKGDNIRFSYLINKLPFNTLNGSGITTPACYEYRAIKQDFTAPRRLYKPRSIKASVKRMLAYDKTRGAIITKVFNKEGLVLWTSSDDKEWNGR